MAESDVTAGCATGPDLSAAEAVAGGGILRVALLCPVDKLFDYAAGGLAGRARAGCRVRVPFGKREAIGLVMEVAETTDVPGKRIKPALALLDEEPLVDAATLKLMQWATAYYSAPVGEVLGFLPRLLREGGPAVLPSRVRWRVTESGMSQRDGLRGVLQRRILEVLAQSPEGVDDEQLGLRLGAGGWRTAAKALLARGLVAQAATAARPQPGPEPALEVLLEPEQQTAYEAIADALGGYAAFLLEGVTSSGKTEVFIRSAQAAIARGEQALVLVPEIGLTPQTVARFRRALPAPVVVLHSGLTDKERAENWLHARNGEAAVVIGTRSAVFAQLPRLGLIIVDEEHDTSLKQTQGRRTRYSARDSAVMRARELGIPVVLASATPSLESLQNVRAGRYRHLVLRRRAGGSQMPAVAVIDLNQERSIEDGISETLIRAIGERLARGEQVLVFINRRGFAPVLVCGDCSWSARCPNCDAYRVVHKAKHQLICHHCGHVEPEPQSCPACGSATGLFPAGEGTQRVEERLAKVFPGYPIVRMDRDAIPGRAALEEALERMRRGEAKILLGTQMLAKGHDFAGVTLVGVIGTDSHLYSADFRSVERLGQTLVQVAGRAGRGNKPGVVMVQTRFPRHEVIRALEAGWEGYRRVAEMELREREQTGLPPFAHMAVALAKSPKQGEAMAFLREAMASEPVPEEVQLFGPMPPVIERVGGEFRAQVVVSSRDRRALQRFLRRWVPAVSARRAPSGLNWAIDVDPLTVS